MKAEKQEDLYFFELDNLARITDMPLENALQQAIIRLVEAFGPITILDDGSVVASALKQITQNIHAVNILVLSDFKRWDQKTVLECEALFGISDRATLQYIQASRSINQPVLWPQGYLRVLNASFTRSLNREYGPPYWVYLENERIHQVGVALNHYNILAVENILKVSPQVFKSYFTGLTSTFNKKTFLHPHNDGIERLMWRELGNASIPLHYAFIGTAQDFQSTKPLNEKFQQAAFPLAGFFRKYLGISQPEFNSLEATFGSTN